MKKGLLLLITLFVYFTSAARVNEDSLWIRNNYVKKEMTIPMRDGVKLFTTVYVTKSNAEKHPILMMRTPYSCAPYGEQYFNNYHTRYINHYFRENYYIVLQDVRGRWMS